MRVQWGFAQTAYDRAKGTLTPVAWHGSLLAHQRDGSGLEAKRARLHDPATGRFTQEDPIGLAGGLNLYGYANGDPVTFSDPFGLCPKAETGIPCTAVYAPGVSISSAPLRQALDDIAAEQDRALNVYSGDRDPGRNARAGGAKGSYQLKGQAADVIFAGTTKQETADMLFHSDARKKAGLRLLYHQLAAALPEHSHRDLAPGADIQEQPR